MSHELDRVPLPGPRPAADERLLERVNRSIRWRAHAALRRALGSTGSPWARIPIWIDYPVAPAPRWGYGTPSHARLLAMVEEQAERYTRHVSATAHLIDHLKRIPIAAPRDARSPSWDNIWFYGLDAAFLYGVVARTNPRVYCEVGSGTSTKFVRRAIEDHGLQTRIVSIDPQPRAEIDGLCDEIIRSSLETADLSIFASLEAGDICFFDGSHRSFPNSDATIALLEILPQLPADVLVHVHDVFLPDDYPPEWSDRLYSEQYLLAAWLLGGGGRSTIEFPSAWLSRQAEATLPLRPLFGPLRAAGAPTGGCSFWLRAGGPT